MRLRSHLATLSMSTLLILLLFVSNNQATNAYQRKFGQPEEPVGIGVSALIFTDNGLEFRLSIPEIIQGDNGRIMAPGLDDVSRVSGEPAIPVFSTYIALPPGKQASVLIKKSPPVIKESIQISPIEQSMAIPESDMFPLSEWMGSQLEFNAKLAPIGEPENRFYPGPLSEVSEPMHIRGIRVSRLVLYPIQYNPITEQAILSRELEVKIEFQETQLGGSYLEPNIWPDAFSLISELLLNKEQFRRWQTVSENRSSSLENSFPKKSDVYKIDVNDDGIYEITYQQLASAGMQVDTINPKLIEMMYRGEPVAYQFIGDSDTAFEPGESVRFHGWKFSGSRLERQYITNNVFWLWVGDNPLTIGEVPSVSGDPVQSLQTSITTEPEREWFPGYTADWDSFPNEPDAWFWDLIATSSQSITKTYQVYLPFPANQGPAAQFTVEVSSRGVFNGPSVLHTVDVSMNGYPDEVSQSWRNERNLNISGEIPLNAVVHGQNHFTIAGKAANIPYPNQSSCTPCIALNRITVDYLQELVLTNDQLTFEDETAGIREFWVKGYSQDNAESLIIWDITEPRIPTSILTGSVTFQGNGPYTVAFGTDHPANSRFIVTTQANVLSAQQITQYNPPELIPNSGGAKWLAIVYQDFLVATEQLANHRQNPQFGGMSTFVVNVEDIINQYGYGLPLPGAIQDYLKQAVASWIVPPSYVLLVGDATRDPRHLRDDWNDEQYLLSDLVFVDPWQGQIPSDLVFSLLDGDDILPDIALGRIAVKTDQELKTVIDKIIQYEHNQLQSFAWMQNLLIISDDADVGGNFCILNQNAIDKLPDSMNAIHLCLDEYSGTTEERGNALRNDIFDTINETGSTIVNYRGHGAINTWGGLPVILATNHISSFDNTTRPVVTITGDCLDGKFTSPSTQGLGELLLRAGNQNGEGIAAAAHWGSSGLGLSSEHSRIIDAFYDGLYNAGLTAIGDAINFAKIKYAMMPGHAPSLIYSFILQGDPAMQIMRPAMNISSKAEPSYTKVRESFDIVINVENQGVYPSHVEVTQEIPDGIQVTSVSASVSATIEYAGNEVKFDLQFGSGIRNKGIPRGEIVSLLLNADVTPSVAVTQLSMASTVTGTGLEAWPGNEIDYAELLILRESVYLPFANR